MAITVKHNLNALYRAEWAMYRPGSPTYHHFLTPAQFRRWYGTRPSVVAAVRRFGTSRGLKLFNPSVLYDYVELYGSVRQVEATFGVRIDRFSKPGTGAFYANVNRPLVPGAPAGRRRARPRELQPLPLGRHPRRPSDDRQPAE